MARTKRTRNPFGTILEKTVIVGGRPRKVWDVRKRYSATDSAGNVLRDARGRKLYRDKTRRCYSKSEAAAALMSLPAEIAEKNRVAGEESARTRERDFTFRELIERFRADEIRPAVVLKGRKIAGYKQNIDSVHYMADLLADYFGDRLIRSITFGDLQTFRTWYASRPTKRGGLPAVSTVNEKMSFLRRVLNYAIRIYWLDVSPFKRGPALIDKAGEAVRNRMLTFEEEERLLAACVDYKSVTFTRRHRDSYRKGPGLEVVTQKTYVGRGRLRGLIIAALDTAMRRGEIFALRWDQIDFDARVIRLTGDAAARTKTGRAGVLPMTGRFYDELRRIRETSPPRETVFERYDIRRAFTGACEDAGIEDLQFRDLRSTGATRMILAGNAESQVMKVTRHGRLKTFLDHYTNVDILNAQKIGRKLDDFIENETDKVDRKGEPEIRKAS